MQHREETRLRKREHTASRAQWILKGFRKLRAQPMAIEGDSAEQSAWRRDTGEKNNVNPDKTGFKVIAQGPVGHIYFDTGTDQLDLQNISQALVSSQQVPVCIFRTDPRKAIAHTRKGVFSLPEEMSQVMGELHPYIEEVEQDLMRLCLHKDAGDIVILGWAEGIPAVSFAMENGSHAGCGPNETDAFVVVPEDVVEHLQTDYLRPDGLREIALNHIKNGTVDSKNALAKKPIQAAGQASRLYTDSSLKVVTYNVHGCIGMDGIVAPERIARVLARLNPDIVALQELDIGRNRTHFRDQAELIAGLLGMNFSFIASFEEGSGAYGNAILSRHPLSNSRTAVMPGIESTRKNEPRSAQWVSIKWNNHSIECLNTHLGLDQKERRAHAQLLATEDWLGDTRFQQRGIMCGDLNSLPQSLVLKTLGSRLRNIHEISPNKQPVNTFASRTPVARIDHILVGSSWSVKRHHIPKDELARVASDHLPLLVELQLTDR